MTAWWLKVVWLDRERGQHEDRMWSTPDHMLPDRYRYGAWKNVIVWTDTLRILGETVQADSKAIVIFWKPTT